LAIAAGVALATPDADPVAEITDGDATIVITRGELEKAALQTTRYRELKDEEGSEKELAKILEKVLDDLVEEKVLAIRAKKLGVALDEADEKWLKDEIDGQAEAFGGVDGMKKAFASIGIPYDTFVEKMRTSRLMSKLLKKEVPEITPTEEQIKAYYDSHRAEFRAPAVTRFYRIDIYEVLEGARIPADVKPLEKNWSRAEAKRFAETVRERADKSPDDWAALAASSGMDPLTAAAGGLVEVKGDWPPEGRGILLGEVADKLRAGDVSPVAESKHGFHVICMSERGGSGTIPLHEVEDQISETIQGGPRLQRIKSWREKVLAETPHKILLPKAPK
jgi:hypothetical protein